VRAVGDLPYGGKPSMWIAKDGFPAWIAGDPTKERQLGGWPTSESDDGFQVYENLIVMMRPGSDQQVRAFPRFYSDMAILSAGGVVPQHHEPTQEWKYRPCIYRWATRSATWQRQGSQTELTWRHGMHQTLSLTGVVEEEGQEAALAQFMLDRVEHEMANRKADELLESMLAPTQLLELRVGERFRVIGGATGSYYRISLGDGFAKVEPASDDTQVNYCLHPEEWMPDSDVALACKLNLEAPDLEEQFVAAANARDITPRIPATPEIRRRWTYALDQEREFIGASA
jgi:hypothetical protein